ncbi:hypothetical protein VNO78_22651 [Psophocarpus tetragonolobus]|uniref:Uncharacterized protein n=1 Tax=Psophocarpus tetragonolobus TaxID=3891 RepID=A0AAN9XCB6_PSOTE
MRGPSKIFVDNLMHPTPSWLELNVNSWELDAHVSQIFARKIRNNRDKSNLFSHGQVQLESGQSNMDLSPVVESQQEVGLAIGHDNSYNIDQGSIVCIAMLTHRQKIGIYANGSNMNSNVIGSNECSGNVNGSEHWFGNLAIMEEVHADHVKIWKAFKDLGVTRNKVDHLYVNKTKQMKIRDKAEKTKVGKEGIWLRYE